MPGGWVKLGKCKEKCELQNFCANPKTIRIKLLFAVYLKHSSFELYHGVKPMSNYQLHVSW